MIDGYFNLSGDLETQSLLDMKMKKQYLKQLMMNLNTNIVRGFR